MPFLYNCRDDGDQWRITKFDSDFNPEASYLLDASNCECPAGHRPTCRHRQMLPKFIARNAVNTQWFFDHDRGGWVQGWKDEPAVEARSNILPTNEIESEYEDEPSLDVETQQAHTHIDEYGEGNPSQTPSPIQSPNPLAESVAEFSGVVTLMVGNENDGSIPCASPSSASGPSLSPTIRRRV